MILSRGIRVAILIAVAALAVPAVAQQPLPPPPPPNYAPPPPPPPPAYAQPVYAQPVYAVQPAPMQPTYPEKKIELSAFAGWQVNGDVSTYAGKVVMDDSAAYGGALDFHVASGATAQLLFIYTSVKTRFQSYDVLYPSTQTFNTAAYYMQIGGTKGVRRGKIEPFGGGTLGAVLVVPDTIKTVNGASVPTSDVWRFAITLGGGLKVHVSEKVALRFEARLLMPMYFSGGAVYVGGGGSGMAVSAGIPAVQGLFTGGLTFG